MLPFSRARAGRGKENAMLAALKGGAEIIPLSGGDQLTLVTAMTSNGGA